MSVRSAIEAVVPAARGARVLAGILAGLAAILLVGFLVWWLLVRPAAARREAAQAKGDAAVATHASEAAQAAVKITVDVDQKHAAIDATTSENDRAIKSSPGAMAPIDPGLARALHDALCLRDAYSGELDCAAVRPADRRVGPAAADPGRRPAG